MATTRLSGLMSGMDTESLIAQLMEGRRTKVTNKKKEQIALQYKQDKWKELNTKLKNLQSKFVSNMRYTTSYSKKTSSVSNTSAASVITGENAVDGVQTLRVDQLAKTGYLTGGQLGTGDDKGNYTALTKMSELDFSGTGNFTVSTGGKDYAIEITENSTISDVLNKFKEAGLNANFDAKNQRFFISSKESGLANDFSITASNEKGDDALTKLGLKVGLDKDEATLKKYQELADKKGATYEETAKNLDGLINAEIEKQKESYAKQYTSLMDTKTDAEKAIADLEAKYADFASIDADKYSEKSKEYQTGIKALEDKIKAGQFADGERKESLEEELKALKEEKEAFDIYTAKKKVIADTNNSLTEVEKFYDANTGDLLDPVKASITKSFVDQVKYAADVIKSYNDGTYSDGGTGATKVNAQNAVISLNGATFENTSNVFEINGLTITALSETKQGEEVTITTQNDVSGIYDMVKNFLKEYNSVINEIDKLYNAASIGTMKPLTSEEKEAVSESEAEEWEKKLRESSLRRDSNLSSIADALKSAMNSSFKVGDTMMSLSDFGIGTLGYFEASDNEKNAFHIDGDADDESTSGKADKLKSMISSDPNTVVKFFTQLGQELYKNMSDISKSVDGYRSFGNFYDDKKIKSDYDSYNSKIAELEEKLNAYEDKWYAKFAKMETAMAKMQSNTSAISAMLGGS